VWGELALTLETLQKYIYCRTNVTYEHSLQALDSKVPKSFPSVRYSGEDASNFNAITTLWSIFKIGMFISITF
jgi:hypothetical protein